jgi:hypothetical protein
VFLKYYSGSEIKKYEMAGNVARVRERSDLCSILIGYLREGDHLEDSSVDGRITLKWIFKFGGGGLVWLRIGTGVGHGECGNKFSVSIKCREFHDWLRACLLLKRGSAPWS